MALDKMCFRSNENTTVCVFQRRPSSTTTQKRPYRFDCFLNTCQQRKLLLFSLKTPQGAFDSTDCAEGISMFPLNCLAYVANKKNLAKLCQYLQPEGPLNDRKREACSVWFTSIRSSTLICSCFEIFWLWRQPFVEPTTFQSVPVPFTSCHI